jgi:outer membrane autotransporter protein
VLDGTSINTSLTNNGTLYVGTVVSGVLTATATVTVSGNFTQGSSGSLQMALASSSVYSQLQVSGSATLAGNLTAPALGTYSPSPGTSFQLITYGSHSGTFSSTPLMMTPSYNSTNFSLLALAEPEPQDSPAPRQDDPEPSAPGPVVVVAALQLPEEIEVERAAVWEDADAVFVAHSSEPAAEPLLTLDELFSLPVAVLEALLLAVV